MNHWKTIIKTYCQRSPELDRTSTRNHKIVEVIQLVLAVEGQVPDKKRKCKVEGKFNRDKDKEKVIIHIP